MEIGLAKTELADVFLLKHGPEPVNIEARDSICAFRGIHFLEENCFVLGFERREWLIEKGTAVRHVDVTTFALAVGADALAAEAPDRARSVLAPRAPPTSLEEPGNGLGVQSG